MGCGAGLNELVSARDFDLTALYHTHGLDLRGQSATFPKAET